MKNLGYLYIIVGIIGLLGSLVAAYVNFTIGEALNLINTQTAPVGTDISALQAQAAAISPLITLAWIWIIAVLAASVITAYFGALTVRDRVSIKK